MWGLLSSGKCLGLPLFNVLAHLLHVSNRDHEDFPVSPRNKFVSRTTQPGADFIRESGEHCAYLSTRILLVMRSSFILCYTSALWPLQICTSAFVLRHGVRPALLLPVSLSPGTGGEGITGTTLRLWTREPTGYRWRSPPVYSHRCRSSTERRNWSSPSCCRSPRPSCSGRAREHKIHAPTKCW